MKKVFVILPAGVRKEINASNVSEAAALAGLPNTGWTFLLNNNPATGDETIPYDFSTLIATQAVKGGM
jgi:ribosome-interacting GTPase 1